MSPEKFLQRKLEREKKVETLSYTLESGVTVDLVSRIFRPENNKNPHRAVIFLPGWAMDAYARSIEKISETFANEYRANTFAITTRTKERGDPDAPTDLLYEEARAIKRYIQEQGLKDVIIGGHSQGADKAIDVATLLQDDGNLTLKGLVLIDAVGLYDQGGFELAAKFTKNLSVDAPKSVIHSLGGSSLKRIHKIAPLLRASSDVIAGIAKEVWRSKLKYWARFKNEVGEMARKNPHSHEVKVPVVVVSGMEDSLSDVERMVPDEKPSPEKRSKNFSGTRSRAREDYIQKTLFPQSPAVHVFVPRKLGVHILPIFRPDSVARVSLSTLECFWRSKKDEG